MLGNEKLFFNNKMSVGRNNLNPKQNIHKLGVNYVCNFLEHAGFTIQEVIKSPDHHFQLLVKVNDKSMIIAVRTACHPDVGTIDKETQEKLIKESERLNAVPHFAGLSLTATNVSDIQVDGMVKGSEHNVIFNGMTVVC